MKNIILLIVILLVICLNLHAQDFIKFNVSTLDNPAPGYLFLDAITKADAVAIWDNTGKVAYSHEFKGLGNGFVNFRILDNKITFFNLSSNKWVITDKDFNILDSITTTPPYKCDFHDFLILPNGNYLLFGNETVIMDMSKLVSGGSPNASVVGYVIQEFDKDKKVVFEWHALDHYNILDVTPDVDLYQSAIEAFHENSIFLDSDNNLIVSNRHLGEVTKINHATGDIIWRMGGSECKNNQFKFINDTLNNYTGFSHVHDVKRLPNGNIILFDNGNLKLPPFSRAVEYKFDETNKTLTKIWEYRHIPDLYSVSMGNVQRLSNGNTFIGWGGAVAGMTNIIANEVDSTGKTVFEMDHPLQGSYRAERIVLKMEASTKSVNSAGYFDLNDSTNKTNISLTIPSLTGKSGLCIEKHHYPADSISTENQIICSVLPYRWVISHYSPIAFTGKIAFDLNNFPDTANFDNTGNLSIFFRKKEGTGKFKMLDSVVYYWNSNRIEGNFNETGEFILGFTKLIPPSVISPADSEKNVPVNTIFKWKKRTTGENYRIQVSANEDFSNVIIDTTLSLDYKWAANPFSNFTKYYWRINSVTPQCESDWSKISVFETSDKTEVTIADENQKSISIFPNPAVDYLNIINNHDEEINIKLFNSMGYELLNLRNANSADLRKFHSGIYFLNIRTGKESRTEKIEIIK